MIKVKDRHSGGEYEITETRAAEVISEWDWHWPGGLEEVEASVDSWRSRALAAEKALHKIRRVVTEETNELDMLDMDMIANIEKSVTNKWD